MKKSIGFVLFVSALWLPLAFADEMVPAAPTTPPESVPTAELPPSSAAVSPSAPSPPVTTSVPKDSSSSPTGDLVPDVDLPIVPQPQAMPDGGSGKEEIITTPVNQDSQEEYPNLKDPKFRHIHPHWSFQFSGSLFALGNHAVAKDDPKVRGFSAGFEFQTEHNSWGTLSFGPQSSIYPAAQSSANFPSGTSLRSFGGVARYQAHFSDRQVLVPEIGYSYDRFTYNLSNIGSGHFTLSGPVFGLYILLNGVDPDAEVEIYVSAGVLRTYFIIEGRALQGADQSLAISGTSVFIGFRLEL